MLSREVFSEITITGSCLEGLVIKLYKSVNLSGESIVAMFSMVSPTSNKVTFLAIFLTNKGTLKII